MWGLFLHRWTFFRCAIFDFSNVASVGSVVFYLPFSPSCVICCGSASLLLALLTALSLPLEDLQLLERGHFLPSASTLLVDLISWYSGLCLIVYFYCHCYWLVCPVRPIFHPASRRALGCFLLRFFEVVFWVSLL